ncbi:hypothetical protein GUJ93_ZPchr0012g19291 [Zizania palustris]|uniref:Uncharacterized protein n=1 Tax=Zizania palustris TaxID=103762 RepID=A0A8J6BSQ0_ZIZPA|nr:hypothetical protein GUJ93_ZPchr0012g19291 [Zizania palustris]
MTRRWAPAGRRRARLRKATMAHTIGGEGCEGWGQEPCADARRTAEAPPDSRCPPHLGLASATCAGLAPPEPRRVVPFPPLPEPRRTPVARRDSDTCVGPALPEPRQTPAGSRRRAKPPPEPIAASSEPCWILVARPLTTTACRTTREKRERKMCFEIGDN